MLPDALFYPFHLCHQETLDRMLMRFRAVHFRDFMALQLTPFSGTTAFRDRMGDALPELLYSGRLVQGYDVSGPISRDDGEAIGRDLADDVWRALFQAALVEDKRFRRGLFDERQAEEILERYVHPLTYSIDSVRTLSLVHRGPGDELRFQYGLALVKTSASLVHTYRLALAHDLQAATDSAPHYALLERSRRRDAIVIGNHLVVRKEY
ncbi:MAG TPA: hypothetical protein VFS39_09905 [Nitrospira sp.]|nr:hypothetical protein [Nitrospira sp.]